MAADTCTAPDGTKPFSFGLEPRTLAFVVVLISSTPFLVVFVLPRILARIGLALGWTLRKRTDGRRALLLSLMQEDDSKFRNGAKGDTEKNQSQNAGAGALSGIDIQQKDWDGIVGFFHPFWYVAPAYTVQDAG